MTVRMRHTKSHTRNRRSHHGIAVKGIVVDKESGVPHLRHRMSLTTGLYKGKKVVDVVSKAEKKQAKSAKKTK